MRRVALRFVAFVAVTGVLTAWIALQITGAEFGDRYRLTASFDDVSGLRTGDAVKLAGVEVGEVAHVEVDLGRAVVDFDVDEDVQVSSDSTIEVRWRNLIGQRYLSIVPGRAAGALADGDVVEDTENVVDLGQLVNQLAPLARSIQPDQLNTILTGLLEAFEGNDETFDGLLRDVDGVLATLAARDRTISGMLEDYDQLTAAVADRDGQIQSMVSNLVAISETFAQNDALLDQALVDLGGFAQGADQFLTASSEDLGAIVDNLAILVGTFTDRVDELELALDGFPAVFAALLPVINQGEWLRVNVVCITLTSGPCPFPMAFDPLEPEFG